MQLYYETLTVEHGVGPDIVDITPLLSDALHASRIGQDVLSASLFARILNVACATRLGVPYITLKLQKNKLDCPALLLAVR